MNVFDEFPKIAKALQQNKIRYALVGGVAMAFHDQPRFTRDIDLLVHPEDFEKLTEILTHLGYEEKAPPWTFQRTNVTLHRFTRIEDQEYLILDILVGHEKKHQTIIAQALLAESEEGAIKVVRKEDLIWLKEQRHSDQDKVDIKKLRTHEED